MTKNIGSRAEVFHGNATKTKGGLTKEDLKLNNYGNIVSIKQSNRMTGDNNPLRKKGYLQTKNSGKFGPNNISDNNSDNEPDNNELENNELEQKTKKEWFFF